jgi:hypothetical protein
MAAASERRSGKSSARRFLTGKTAFVISIIGIAAIAAVSAAFLSAPDMPGGVTLRQVDGGPHYFAGISPRSAWMDRHILLGAWLEQPLGAADVAYDRAAGANIYWNLAGSPIAADCGGSPCRADYNVIRRGGMHVSAPDVTVNSGFETVAYEGWDEADLQFGPGWGAWDGKTHKCVTSHGHQVACGYTVARWFYSGMPASLGSPGYPVTHTVKHQGYGKGVLFFETPKQAAVFLRFSDILSADSYWMTDSSLNLPSQGGCALFPKSRNICNNGSGSGLTNAQRALPANYAYNVTKLESLQRMNGPLRPVIVDIETGCPGFGDKCTNPAAMTAAAWHALIAGARGILWFQHNFGGPCVDDRSIIDGSNPADKMYKCQQSPGVTLHHMVQALTRFNTEVNKLDAVLLSPFADHYVTAKGDVSVMAKYSNGQFYIFAGSGRPGDPPSPGQRVTFRLAGAPNTSVTVLNEHRTLRVTNGEFSDTFANANTIHIYRVS